MKLLKMILCFSLFTGLAYAQEEESSLPDLPVVNESAPQEAPFTQPENEFEEASKNSAIGPTEPTAPAETAQKTSSTSLSETSRPTGQVLKGSGFIEHPMAAKGLIRIEKDGSYIYRTKKAPHSETGSLRFGSLQPPNIVSADKETDFKSMYSKDNIPIVMFDYEWQPFSSFGKLGMQIGFAFFTAQGSGRFLVADPTTGNTKAEEKYTFIALPLNVGFVYRMEFSDRQWLAPYISGGGSYIPLVEMRDDGKAPHGVGTPAAYGAGGMMFSVSSFDRETAYALDSEYGIKNLWVAFEYRYLKSFSQDLDLTAGIINLGISVDY